MSLPIVFRPEAQADVLAARHWYDHQQVGLGDAFVEAVEQMISRIEQMPESYALVLPRVRRGKIRRFPYVTYYRVLPDRIEVIAVLHGSRDPRIWQQRVDETTQ